MRIILFLLFLYAINVQAQDSLYYFKSEKGLVGVRNQVGKILIKPIFPVSNIYRYDKPLLDETIEFYFLPQWDLGDQSRPATRFGAVYNRKGEFLYYPQFCDNGPDYWLNDVRRYVENGKIGLVNRKGEKITPAKWDFGYFVEDAYLKVYLGDLKKDYSLDVEKWDIVGDTLSYYVNLKGERVDPPTTEN